jgi:hypothetical protein
MDEIIGYLCPSCGEIFDGKYCYCCGFGERATPPKPRNFPAQVAVELDRARAGHNNINSLHEGYAVILEEMDEVWDEIKKKRSQRDSAKLLAELIQIAAMCQRTAEDCGLCEAPHAE